MQAIELIPVEKHQTPSEVYAIIDGERYELCNTPEFGILDEDVFEKARVITRPYIIGPKMLERTVKRGNEIFNECVESNTKTRDSFIKYLRGHKRDAKSKSWRNHLAEYEYNVNLLNVASSIVFVLIEDPYQKVIR